MFEERIESFLANFIKVIGRISAKTRASEKQSLVEKGRLSGKHTTNFFWALSDANTDEYKHTDKQRLKIAVLRCC